MDGSRREGSLRVHELTRPGFGYNGQRGYVFGLSESAVRGVNKRDRYKYYHDKVFQKDSLQNIRMHLDARYRCKVSLAIRISRYDSTIATDASMKRESSIIIFHNPNAKT